MRVNCLAQEHIIGLMYHLALQGQTMTTAVEAVGDANDDNNKQWLGPRPGPEA